MQKQEKIVSMFDEIAPTYDKANRIMSMGVDRSWRKKGCDKAFEFYAKQECDLIVDVACGTGDMMGFWRERSDLLEIKVNKILGVDPSEGMVAVGREKFADEEFAIAPATKLPCDSDSADILSISYGIRNVVERKEALDEFHRVLKDGGMVVILEFMKSENPSVLGRIRDFYMSKILPKVGGFISKNTEAYTYLPDSIGEFLTVSDMIDELKNAGFKTLFTQSFSMDISTLIIAKKI